MSAFNFAYSQNQIYNQKREMSSLLINKTPISLLQEWLNHLGISPKYELLQGVSSISQNHCHSFCIRVSVGEVAAVGSGRSKKEAKHAAARALLYMLLDRPFAKRQANFTNLTNGSGEETCTLKHENLYNPVGKLQELCTAKNWAHPIYVLVSEEGPPHVRLFAISVEVQNMKQTGTGRSKRLAKHEAALKMFHQLSNQIIKAESEYNCDEGHRKGIDISYAQLLQDVAEQQKIQVHYKDIEDKTPNGLFQCIVRISTWPIIVCRGQGPTPKVAVNNAAMHALDCLSLVIKKHTTQSSQLFNIQGVCFGNSICHSSNWFSYFKHATFVVTMCAEHTYLTNEA